MDYDTPSYQLSITKVRESFSVIERYASRKELWGHFGHMGNILNLRKGAVLNARVKQVRYNVWARRCL